MKVLILYYSDGYPLRTAVDDHLYCFQRYSDAECYYLNVAVRGLPGYMQRIQFDLIIFHTIFHSQRWNMCVYERILKAVEPLKRTHAVKVMMPQDEFFNTDVLCDFIREFNIVCVFTNAEPADRRRIYHSIDDTKVKFVTVLTGYLDERTIARVRRLASPGLARDIDIGYRAWRATPWLGKHGLLKTKIAEVFAQQAPAKGIRADISLREQDTLLGDEWNRFLLRCKYTIGVEGGASIHDRDGVLRGKTEAYIAAHPGANFDDIYAVCCADRENSLTLFAITPRHFEACMTRTCQILIEGGYNGVLKPGEHFVELKRDFSNLDAVLDCVKRDDLREGMIQRAHQDIVESGQYTYSRFVKTIYSEALGVKAHSQDGSRSLLWHWARLADKISWFSLAVRASIRKHPRIANLLRRILRGNVKN